MSTQSPRHPDEHKTISSYIVGFILSLAFTILPYYIVVNHVYTGKLLLMTILGFALVQLVIQVIFFLHLGRGPKPNWNLYFFISTIGIILIVVGGSIVIINNLHGNMVNYDQTKALINDEGIYQVNGAKTGACHGQYTNHTVTIKDGRVTPSLTIAGRCDTLTITNKDNVEREISFGPHPEHQTYAGITDIQLRKGRSKTITLSETGRYQFHDHEQPDTAGSFAVVGDN